MKQIIFIFIIIIFLMPPEVYSERKQPVLSLKKFIVSAAHNDPAFQVILIDTLYNRYRKDLSMPARDLVLDITGSYNLVLYKPETKTQYTGGSETQYLSNLYKTQQDNDDQSSFDGTIALSKLFPYTGTTVSGGYSVNRNYISGKYQTTSSFSAEISQPIARNAFGRANRLTLRKINIENSLAYYQVVEAYEDYMASLVSLYMDWFASWKNMKAAEAILRYNREIYQTTKRKQQYRVALPVDVNKIRLELLSAQENLVKQKDQFQRTLIRMCETAGLKVSDTFIPSVPRLKDVAIAEGHDSIDTALAMSRTSVILSLIERKGVLNADIVKDNLLPSVTLNLGYSMRGQDYWMKDMNQFAYAGVTSGIGFFRQKEKAAYKTSQVDLKKTRLSNKSKRLSLKMDCRELKHSIERERKLNEINRKKVIIAEKVLSAEIGYYRIGKTSLNDLISIKKSVEQIRYDVILHEIAYKKLLLEWRRLTDTLVRKDDLVSKKN